MFEFLKDYGNYAARCVGRLDYQHGFISTARVSDGEKDYETAVEDARYTRNDGQKTMAIVQAYDTKEEAQAGHALWVERMTKGDPPATLSDCSNSGIAQLKDAVTKERDVWTLDAA